MGFHPGFRDAFDGIERLLFFNAMLSYAVTIVMGVPLYLLSIRNKWYSLWENAVAGFFTGTALGFIAVLILSLMTGWKWYDIYSPFLAALYIGITGLITMSALWPFIEYDRALPIKR